MGIFDIFKGTKRSLTQAVLDNDIPTVKQYVDEGSDPNAIDTGFDISPLVISIAKNNHEAFEELLRNVSDVSEKILFDGKKWPLLALAITYEQDIIVDTLINENADVNAEFSDDEVDYNILCHVVCAQKNDKNRRSMYIEKLISAGADINASGGDGYRPIELAIIGGEREITKALLKYKPEINFISQYSKVHTQIAMTLLAVSTKSSDETYFFELLLDSGADPYLKSENGMDTFAIVEALGYKKHAKILEKYKVDNDKASNNTRKEKIETRPYNTINKNEKAKPNVTSTIELPKTQPENTSVPSNNISLPNPKKAVLTENDIMSMPIDTLIKHELVPALPNIQIAEYTVEDFREDIEGKKKISKKELISPLLLIHKSDELRYQNKYDEAEKLALEAISLQEARFVIEQAFNKFAHHISKDQTVPEDRDDYFYHRLAMIYREKEEYLKELSILHRALNVCSKSVESEKKMRRALIIYLKSKKLIKISPKEVSVATRSNNLDQQTYRKIKKTILPAVKNNDFEKVREIVSKYGEHCSIFDGHRKHILYFADNEEMVKLLVSNGVSLDPINLYKNVNFKQFEWYVDNTLDFDINFLDKESGVSLLEYVLSERLIKIEYVKYLIEKGAETSFLSKYSAKESNSLPRDIKEYLLSHGLIKIKNNVTALMIAAHDGNMENVKKYIKNGVNVNETDKLGNNALHHIFGKFKTKAYNPKVRLKVFSYLVEKGCDKYALNKDGVTPDELARKWFNDYNPYSDVDLSSISDIREKYDSLDDNNDKLDFLSSINSTDQEIRNLQSVYLHEVYCELIEESWGYGCYDAPLLKSIAQCYIDCLSDTESAAGVYCGLFDEVLDYETVSWAVSDIFEIFDEDTSISILSRKLKSNIVYDLTSFVVGVSEYMGDVHGDFYMGEIAKCNVDDINVQLIRKLNAKIMEFAGKNIKNLLLQIFERALELQSNIDECINVAETSMSVFNDSKLAEGIYVKGIELINNTEDKHKLLNSIDVHLGKISNIYKTVEEI